MSSDSDAITLDANNPFDALLIPIVLTNRRKSADYASPADLYLNFRRNADMVALPGYTPLVDCFSMVARKLGRIANLRGRSAQNEGVLDSYLDLAVYAVLAYGLAMEEADAEKAADEGTGPGVEGPLHFYAKPADAHPEDDQPSEPGPAYVRKLGEAIRDQH